MKKLTLSDARTAARGLVSVVMTRQSRWAIVDQALSSGTNFGAAIFVARLLGPAAFGSFTYAYTAWITCMALSRSWMIQTYTVTAAPMSGEDRRLETRNAASGILTVSLLGMLILMALSLFVGWRDPTGQALACMSFFLPFLMIQDFWRFVGFASRRADAAAANDGVWAVTQACALGVIFLLGVRSPAAAVLAWGCGALAGALWGIRQFRCVPHLNGSAITWLRHAMSKGGWFGFSNVVGQVSLQGQVLLLGGLFGRAALGGFRSVSNMFGPSQLITIAGEALGLPAAARSYARGGSADLRRVVVRYSAILGIGLSAYAIPFMFFGHTVSRFVFGAAFGRYSALIVPLSLAALVPAWGSGAFIGLRTIGRGRSFSLLILVSVVVRLGLMILLSFPFGLVGAAWGAAIGQGLRVALLWVELRRQTRLGARPAPSTETEPHLVS